MELQWCCRSVAVTFEFAMALQWCCRCVMAIIWSLLTRSLLKVVKSPSSCLLGWHIAVCLHACTVHTVTLSVIVIVLLKCRKVETSEARIAVKLMGQRSFEPRF